MNRKPYTAPEAWEVKVSGLRLLEQMRIGSDHRTEARQIDRWGELYDGDYEDADDWDDDWDDDE